MDDKRIDRIANSIATDGIEVVDKSSGNKIEIEFVLRN